MPINPPLAELTQHDFLLFYKRTTTFLTIRRPATTAVDPLMDANETLNITKNLPYIPERKVEAIISDSDD